MNLCKFKSIQCEKMKSEVMRVNVFISKHGDFLKTGGKVHC